MVIGAWWSSAACGEVLEEEKHTKDGGLMASWIFCAVRREVRYKRAGGYTLRKRGEVIIIFIILSN